MGPPVEIARHLHSTSSSSNQSSPSGTPPSSLHSQPPRNTRSTPPPAPPASLSHSPNQLHQPLPSPSIQSSNNNNPNNNSNRFGLALNFIQRRPRGNSVTTAGGRSPGANGSPGSELPPSPGEGRERTSGYGFPALRRTLSRRAGSSSSALESPSSSSQGTARVATTRGHRSSSQPPANLSNGNATDSADSRPNTPSAANNNNSNSQDHQNMPSSSLSFPALTTSASLPVGASVTTPTVDGGPSATSTTSTGSERHKLRLVPHLESNRSLHFDPVDRDLQPFTVLRVGRFTDRSLAGAAAAAGGGGGDPLRIAFKSKVVSRGHAEVWCDDSGKFFIKDTKSSSGTFLNHIRLSGPNTESRAFPLKDGDVLQLGVDYQGGTEEIYRCVKMRVELNRGWQRGMNSFNTQALAQLRALGGGSQTEVPTMAATASSSSMSAAPTQKVAQTAPASVTDCCICLYPVTVCQALFIAPCSHVTHFKCIRPLVNQNYPGFCCPLCRTYADLEADVEIEWEPEPEPAGNTTVTQPETVKEEPEAEEDAMAVDEEPAVTEDSSRRPSLPISGPDGIPVSLPVAEHHRPSRPSSIAPSIKEEPSSSSPVATTSATTATTSLPLPVSIGRSSMDDSFQTSVYNSLAEAATPPNSTFLSTLADHGAFPRYHGPVSLGMAFDRFAPPTPGSGEAGPSRTERDSFGSEEGTDGPRDDEDVEIVVAGLDKGKGVERRPVGTGTGAGTGDHKSVASVAEANHATVRL